MAASDSTRSSRSSNPAGSHGPSRDIAPPLGPEMLARRRAGRRGGRPSRADGAAEAAPIGETGARRAIVPGDGGTGVGDVVRPIIVGAAQVANKDPERLAHPVDLIEDAVRLAVADAGADPLPHVGLVLSSPLSV